MKRKTGDPIIPITLPALDGSTFELESMKGRHYLLSFLRFASCPFCNLRIHELVKRFDELGENFSIVAIFDSSLENLQRYAKKHHAPFPILADVDNKYYKVYGVEKSWAGVFKGMVFRLPTLLKGMFVKGYLPLVIKGSMLTMPADFLVDEEGVIRVAYYGKDEGDHLPFEQVRAFAQVVEKSVESPT